ncbi:hypothetical protein MAR_013376 [Mya arenaria]|uniref:Uncharacterized protein n=2 Tax=Mya arenaria TaxID=6604 RepID=A0ABY7G2X9_MYAAR|nr:hypothetical protein MAR_013376 [Mya arenaria]
MDSDNMAHAVVNLVFETTIPKSLILAFTDSLLNIMKENAARETFADGTVALIIGPLYVFMESLQADSSHLHVRR